MNGFPGNQRILIADDDPGIRHLLTTYLRGQGFQSLEACNGREALEEMRAGHADLVILDLMMPEVPGAEVLRERAANAELRQIPVIVTSANIKGDVAAAVLGNDVVAVLGKPFDLDALMTIVTTCLEGPAHVPAWVAA